MRIVFELLYKFHDKEDSFPLFDQIILLLTVQIRVIGQVNR